MPHPHHSSDRGFLPVESRRKQRLVPLMCLITAGLSLVLLARPMPSFAEMRLVTATGAHRMTDRETKIDAIRLATEQAKKQALEQVASYLESVTVVRDLDVTQDDIRSYTAGMVLVLDQQVDTGLDGDVVVIRVTLKAQVDSEEAARAIAALRQHEDARKELVALKDHIDELHRQLDDANHALARAKSPEQTRALTRQRSDLLNQAEADAMVAQAWTDWVLMAPFAQPYPSAGATQVQALLAIAGRLNPDNPHLAIARQTLGTKSPPAPPQPRRPPVPHTVPVLPGYSLVPQQPTSPRTLPSPPNGSTMPTYRQIPVPDSPSAHPTLRTYRSGGDLSNPASTSSDKATRESRQTPPVSPSHSAPQNGSVHDSQEGK
jgi:mannitol/fructose-specific phosphotransferase system IIA component (Ntr-type)